MTKLTYLLVVTFAGCLCSDIIYENEVVGNPDDNAIIIRPCQVSDLNCIRQYFKEHAKCKVMEGPLPATLIRSQYTVYFSRVNVSGEHTNQKITGFDNTIVDEFYGVWCRKQYKEANVHTLTHSVNEATNRVVIVVRIRNVTEFLPAGYYRFFRNGQEPVVVLSTTSIFYRSISYTTIIPNADHLALEKAEVTGFSDDSVAPYYLGPELATNPDPTVRLAVAELAADQPSALQEIFLTEAYYFALTYIQTNICDFGLKVL